jgi:hypothetical protein
MVESGRKKKMSIKSASMNVFALVLFCATAGFAQQGQNSLTQTTLSSQVNGPAFYNGTSPTIDNCMVLASVTGINAPTLPGTPVSVIYVDREAFGVLTVNTSTKIACGFRGYLGTQAAPHPSGDMVLIAPAYQTNNPVPNGLFNVDPPTGSTCSAAVPTNVWVNVLTGSQWLCSSITKTWVPGFVNPLTTVIDAPTTAVASATTILPTGPLFHLTGSTAVTTITTPVGCNATAVGGCQFTMIVDTGTASQFGTGGNLEIGAAITTLTGKAYSFIWDATQSKWVISG